MQQRCTLIGLLSGGEQSSDVESGSSSEELMKHRPQGSLSDSSCQDCRRHTHVSEEEEKAHPSGDRGQPPLEATFAYVIRTR